jgi:hypothetical protein
VIACHAKTAAHRVRRSEKKGKGSELTIDATLGFWVVIAVMSRPLRIQYAGARYHVMSRGDRREAIFHDDADREGKGGSVLTIDTNSVILLERWASRLNFLLTTQLRSL